MNSASRNESMTQPAMPVSTPDTAGGSYPVAAVLTAVFMFLMYTLPISVGLNGDMNHYAQSGLSLICEDWRSVWGNYGHEPVFFSVLWVSSEAWNFLFSSGCHQITGTSRFWLPIFMAVVFILLLIHVTRHLGRSAIYFHMVVCLDTALMMLPFNLLRQFMALVIVVWLLSLLLRERITPIAFSVYLAVPALIHWAAWLLVLAAVPAVMASRIHIVREHISKAREAGTAILWAVVTLALCSMVIIYYYDFLAAKLLARLGDSPAYFSLFSPVTPLSTHFSGNLAGSGFFTFLNLIVVVAFAYAANRYLRNDFARRFVVSVAILYVLIPLFGADAIVMQRARVIVLAVVYFMFLHIRNNGFLSARWEIFNLGFLLYGLSSFFWHEVVVRPFEGRLSFALLGL
jgi:hypothetical protein